MRDGRGGEYEEKRTAFFIHDKRNGNINRLWKWF